MKAQGRRMKRYLKTYWLLVPFFIYGKEEIFDFRSVGQYALSAALSRTSYQCVLVLIP